MAKGLMGLRRYQTGGGIGDPGDDWLEKLIRQLLRRWEATRGPKGPPKSIEPWGTPVHIEDQMKEVGSWRDELKASSHGKTWPIKDVDDLIDLSNLDITFGDEGMSITPAPLPHAVPPLAVPPLSDTPTLLDQPVHDLDEAFRSNQVDDLIRGIGGLPPTEGVHFPPHDSRLARWNPLPANFYFGEGWGDKRGVYMDHPIKQGIVDAAQLADNLSRLGFKHTPKWGSIAAPLLAAAVSPAALAAETAFDFAISPESLGGTASEVPGAGRTWRESPHIDPSDEEVASFMSSLLPYTQHQLARPSTGSQRALDELIRRAQAGTPVNRYRR